MADRYIESNTVKNLSNDQNKEELNNASQNNDSPIRPTTLNVATTINTTHQEDIHRYNIDHIQMTPSPIDTQPRIFQAGSLFDLETFERIKLNVDERTKKTMIKKEEKTNEDNDNGSKQVSDDISNPTTTTNEIERLTQLIIRERPVDHNEVADTLLDLIGLTTDKYEKTREIDVTQPAIVLLNPGRSEGALGRQPISYEDQCENSFWQQRAIIYRMGIYL
ncbi:unnamed protein product [Rotaria sp. Silwood1]|nr:unnamed protein product [Rotaria sp. Silwood1]